MPTDIQVHIEVYQGYLVFSIGNWALSFYHLCAIKFFDCIDILAFLYNVFFEFSRWGILHPGIISMC